MLGGRVHSLGSGRRDIVLQSPDQPLLVQVSWVFVIRSSNKATRTYLVWGSKKGSAALDKSGQHPALLSMVLVGCSRGDCVRLLAGRELHLDSLAGNFVLGTPCQHRSKRQRMASLSLLSKVAQRRMAVDLLEQNSHRTGL